MVDPAHFEILEGVGFTKAESKVYLSLIELGAVSVGSIIERTGLQSSVVHMILNRLIHKGFVSIFREGGKRVYHACDPKNISSHLGEKMARFEEILPQLASTFAYPPSEEVLLYRGKRGAKWILLQVLELGKGDYRMFGASKEAMMLGDAWWVSFHRKRADLHIKAKLLFSHSLRYWKPEGRYRLSKVRYSSKNFEPLTETIIRDNLIALLLWTENPLGILIRNQALARSYDFFFKTLWENAPPQPWSKTTAKARGKLR